jgi:hypothetical protein
MDRKKRIIYEEKGSKIQKKMKIKKGSYRQKKKNTA